MNIHKYDKCHYTHHLVDRYIVTHCIMKRKSCIEFNKIKIEKQTED